MLCYAMLCYKKDVFFSSNVLRRAEGSAAALRLVADNTQSLRHDSG